MKKLFVVLSMLSAICLPAWSATSRGSTLIVAPARYAVMQVMFDVVSKRDAVLLSYQGEASTQNPLLHYWNGATWAAIDVHDLNELRFLTETPARAVMVGDNSLLPQTVKDSLAWLPQVETVTALEHAGLINQLDEVFNWSGREWKWFAKRYSLNLDDQNLQARERSWYDQAGPLKRAAGAETVTPEAPIQRAPISEAPVTEEVLAPIEETPAVEPSPAPAVEKNDEIDEVIQVLERERSKSDAQATESYPIK